MGEAAKPPVVDNARQYDGTISVTLSGPAISSTPPSGADQGKAPRSLLDILIAIGTFLSGVGTLVMVFVLWSTLKATQESADAAVQNAKTAAMTLKVAYRPRLVFGKVPNEPLTFVPAPDVVADKPQFRFIWKIDYENDGRGVATHIWSRPTLESSPFGPSQHNRGFPYLEPSFEAPLKPGAQAVAKVEFILDADAVADVKNGKNKLTIDLVVDYGDEFGDVHHSRLCATYEMNGGWSSLTMCKDGITYD